MTSAGPTALRSYASGGIANSPQLALFGEGSRPEAYVPLPDGRSIPVTISGAGGGGDVFNISVSLTDSGASSRGDDPGGRDLGRAIASAVRQELLAQKRAGGLLDGRRGRKWPHLLGLLLLVPICQCVPQCAVSPLVMAMNSAWDSESIHSRRCGRWSFADVPVVMP